MKPFKSYRSHAPSISSAAASLMGAVLVFGAMPMVASAQNGGATPGFGGSPSSQPAPDVKYGGVSNMSGDARVAKPNSRPTSAKPYDPNNTLPDSLPGGSAAPVPIVAPEEAGGRRSTPISTNFQVDADTGARIELLNQRGRIPKTASDIEQSARAMSKGLGAANRVENHPMMVPMDAGSPPMVIRPSISTSTTLIVGDSLGQPWKVMDAISYPKGDFSLFRKNNIVTITPLGGSFVQGSLTLMMEAPVESGGMIPVIFTLSAGQKVADGKVTVTLDRINPMMPPRVGLALPNDIDPDMLSVLQGVGPAGVAALRLSGGGASGAQAWPTPDGRYMYIRSSYQITSPAPLMMTQTPDGSTRAYKVPASYVIGYQVIGQQSFGQLHVESSMFTSPMQ